MTVWAVWATEPAPPAGVEALDWLLLTTVPLTTTEGALTCLAWYACRWGIDIRQPPYPHTQEHRCVA